MQHDYVSDAGREFLSEIRVGGLVPQVQGRAPVRLLACVPSEECGCPEEVWQIDGIEAVIHFEANGSSEMFLFCGDWEGERSVLCQGMPDLRAALFAWVAELSVDDGSEFDG